MELRWEELEKAHRNLRQIYLYLQEAVRSAGMDPVPQETLQEIRTTARSIRACLEELAEANGIEIEPAALPSDPPGHARLDPARLRAVTAYLGKMLRWIESTGEATVPEGCREPFCQLHTLTEAIEGLSPSQDGAAPGGHQEGTPAGDDPLAYLDTAPSGPEAVDVPDVGELVLEHTFKDPLLHGVEGKYELTQRAVTVIDEFFARAQLDYDRGERRRLYRKIARWLEATPDGMVLALRIGGLSGRPEPYPKYRPRQDSSTS